MTIKPRTKTFSEFLFYAKMTGILGQGIATDAKLSHALKFDAQRATNACNGLVKTVQRLLGEGTK